MEKETAKTETQHEGESKRDVAVSAQRREKVAQKNNKEEKKYRKRGGEKRIQKKPT